MARSNFRQRDLQRIFRAAKAIDATVEIDLETLVATVLPAASSAVDPTTCLAPDGPEQWDEYRRRDE